MAGPTYVGQGAVGALTTAGLAAYPATVTAGALLKLVAICTGTVPTDQTAGGWIYLGVSVNAAGLNVYEWIKTASGSETGNYTISGVTGTTTGGVCYIKEWTASAGGTLVCTPLNAVDTDNTSTAFSCSGGALPMSVDDIITAEWAMLAPSGSYSANASGPGLTLAGATLTVTTRFSARTASNVIAYGSLDGTVTAIDTPTNPLLVATGVGANAAGVCRFTKIHEVPAAASPQTPKGVVNATKFGSAASIIAGLIDALATTGAQMSGTVGDVSTYIFDDALPTSGSVTISFKAFGNGGAATITARLYAADGVTAVAAAQNFTLTGSEQSFDYVLTSTENTNLTNRRGLQLKITQNS